MADWTTDLLAPTSAECTASNSTNTATNVATGAIASTSVSEILNVAPQPLTAASTSLIPTTDFLRTNEQIQKQVDARFTELHNAQTTTSTSGKLKSQRGG